MPGIVVTMPAYNEEKTVGRVIAGIQLVLCEIKHKVQVVSDGSTDATVIVASMNGAEVIDKDHGGLADTFRVEMEYALKSKPDIIVHTDADGQYMADDMIPLIRAVIMGADLVLGSRLAGTIEEMPRSKESCNKLLTQAMRLWLDADITDATTGFRAFKPHVAALPIKSNYTYTLEQIYRAKKAGYKIKSVPIHFLGRSDGDSRLMKSPWHYFWETLKNVRSMTK